MRHRLVLILGLCAGALAPMAPLANGDPPFGRALSVDLPADSPLDARGAIAVSPPFEGFGGISGLAMTGRREALAITDRGDWLRLGLSVEGGRLVGLNRAEIAPILDGDGQPVDDNRFDAEDLTRDPETGALWVSFESDHRVERYDGPDGRPGQSIRHRDWRRFGFNSGVEALARDDEGRVWAIGEYSGKVGRPFPIYILDGDRWAIKRLPRPSAHAVTGAAFGPDGWLYVTEREFGYASGFDIRLRRLRWDGAGEYPVEDQTLAEFGPGDGLDNIEAVTLWREDGETYLLIASDDNFFILQRNVLALFTVRD